MYSYASSNENSRCESSSGKRKIGENTGMAADESQTQKRGDRRSKEQGQKSSFCVIDGSLSSQEFGVGTTSFRNKRVELYSEAVLWKMIQYRMLYSLNISITNDGCKSNGYYIKTTRMRRTSSRRKKGLHPGQNGRCTDFIKHSKVRMSRHVDRSTKTQMA